MKSFQISQALLYNPTRTSMIKKPIQIEVQSAKILAYYPCNAVLQQKCNSVGMAEGVYTFCSSLIKEQQLSPKPIQIITMDSCCLVVKQLQQNIWLFLKLQINLHNEQSYQYINNYLTQSLCKNIIKHIYESFHIFYGRINKWLFLDRCQQLQKIWNYFIPAYTCINSYEDTQELNISSYLLSNIKNIPLDVNTTLKLNYFKNVLNSYNQNITDLMVFSRGYLAYSSFSKEYTNFFSSYLFSIGEPFKFESSKLKRFQYIQDVSGFQLQKQYGTLLNSTKYETNNTSQNRISSNTNNEERNTLISNINTQDLLGLQEQKKLNNYEVYLIKDGEEGKYQVTYYFDDKIFILTCYSEINNLRQLDFQNKFYRDNASRFTIKFTQSFNILNNQSDAFRFLFYNSNTWNGKCTFKEWNYNLHELIYTLENINRQKQQQIATTFQNHWIYAFKKYNRILIIMIPNQVPLHKLEQFTTRMTKQYFNKAYI